MHYQYLAISLITHQFFQIKSTNKQIIQTQISVKPIDSLFDTIHFATLEKENNAGVNNLGDKSKTSMKVGIIAAIVVSALLVLGIIIRVVIYTYMILTKYDDDDSSIDLFNLHSPSLFML